MNELLHKAKIRIADANAIAKGLDATLEYMEADFLKDARYYALRACIDGIITKTEEAFEMIDEYGMLQVRAGGASAEFDV